MVEMVDYDIHWKIGFAEANLYLHIFIRGSRRGKPVLLICRASLISRSKN